MFRTIIGLIAVGAIAGTLSEILILVLILVVVVSLLGLSILAARHVGHER